MPVEKVFIGPKMRELRNTRNLTQAQMAQELGVSASYVNLVERNQRPASLKLLITLSDIFGLNWRELSQGTTGLALSDLRQITKDPAFGGTLPDIEELRSALESSPKLIEGFVRVYNAYRSYGERLGEINEFLPAGEDTNLNIELGVHDFFRSKNNHFPDLEDAAASCLHLSGPDRFDAYGFLRRHIEQELGYDLVVVRDEILGNTLRVLDRTNKTLQLSDGLDHTNRIFQMAHMVALIQFSDLLDAQLPEAIKKNDVASTRCRVELANYFAAALMMPYHDFFEEAQNFRYDIERLAARFSVSYEQACHRLTTLQKPGKRGIPFFFLRIDRGGNVSKRFNVTPIQLARFGGACPKLDVHYCFRVPGRILTQTVEMPDNSKYLTINRTVDRPSIKFSAEDTRLAVSIGCPVQYAPEITYGKTADSFMNPMVTKVGVNCRLCPREKCEQRAHEPFHASLSMDEDKRGLTSLEN